MSSNSGDINEDFIESLEIIKDLLQNRGVTNALDFLERMKGKSIERRDVDCHILKSSTDSKRGEN